MEVWVFCLTWFPVAAELLSSYICLPLRPLSPFFCPCSLSPVHSFPVSSCACRRSCDDESVAAVCLCVWHCDVSLLALTPSLSLCLPFFSPPYQVSFSLSLYPSVSCSLSFSLILSLLMTRHHPASCLRDETDRTHRPTTDNNNKQELSSTICPLIFTGGIFEIAHLTFRPNGRERRKQRR